jgi:hypothetical protein
MDIKTNYVIWSLINFLTSYILVTIVPFASTINNILFIMSLHLGAGELHLFTKF